MHSSFKLPMKNRHHTRGITLKRVASGGVYLRGLAPGLQSSEETSQRRRVVGNTAYDLTGPGFEPQTSLTDSKVLTTEQPGQSLQIMFVKSNQNAI